MSVAEASSLRTDWSFAWLSVPLCKKQAEHIGREFKGSGMTSGGGARGRVKTAWTGEGYSLHMLANVDVSLTVFHGQEVEVATGRLRRPQRMRVEFSDDIVQHCKYGAFTFLMRVTNAAHSHV